LSKNEKKKRFLEGQGSVDKGVRVFSGRGDRGGELPLRPGTKQGGASGRGYKKGVEFSVAVNKGEGTEESTGGGDPWGKRGVVGKEKRLPKEKGFEMQKGEAIPTATEREFFTTAA